MRKNLYVLLLAAGALAFVLGVVWLFELRLDTGDVYPAYSSLRSDPLGTMALYESLERLPGFSVQRDYTSTNQLPTEPGTVYLHLGGQSYEWDSVSKDVYREIGDFLNRGGRLVIAFYPKNQGLLPPAFSPEKTDAKKPAATAPNKKKTTLDGKPEDDDVSLKEKWGLTFGFAELPDDGESLLPVSVRNVSGLPLPPMLLWHSGMTFTNLDSAWTTIYARDQDAVVIARQFGRGSVVLASDSYFLSNEALSKDRHANLLAWLIGSDKRVVFDEAHFGIVSDPGVAALMRQYHLAGLVAGLLLLAALFMWKNFSSLVPLAASEKLSPYVAGKDSAAGFVNLLRRNIPASEVLGVCFEEWKKSAAGARPGAKRAEVQAVMDAEKARPARQRNAVEVYGRIALILKQPAFSGAPTAPNPPPKL